MLLTKRDWKIIVFVDNDGKMKSRVCTSCGKLRLAESFLANVKGIGGKRPDCTACYMAKHEKTLVLRNNRYRSKLKGLPSDMTLEKIEKAKGEQAYKCILTESAENLTTDHFMPLMWGTGLGDTFGNVSYISKGLNASKGYKNPFIWIRTQPREIKLRFFNKLVPMLAERNGLTPNEFEEYVNNEYAKYEESKGE